jgi:alpha-glucoside transport system permease protein
MTAAQGARRVEAVGEKAGGGTLLKRIALHGTLVVLMIIWLLPTIGLLVNSFPGLNILFVAVVGLLVVPLQTTFIPILQTFANFGINGQFLALWLAHTGYGLPFAIYLLRNFMGALPREVFESAYIDGASPVTAFVRLALPMSVPAIASLAIFQFLFVWNDLLVAFVYIGAVRPENLPMTVQIANLVNQFGGGIELLGPAAFISMALPLVVFFSLQRYFVRGITGGAVKG